MLNAFPTWLDLDDLWISMHWDSHPLWNMKYDSRLNPRFNHWWEDKDKNCWFSIYPFRLELNGPKRRLTWEATPRSIHEGVSSAITKSDCLVFDSATAHMFAENGNLGINVTVSMCNSWLPLHSFCSFLWSRFLTCNFNVTCFTFDLACTDARDNRSTMGEKPLVALGDSDSPVEERLTTYLELNIFHSYMMKIRSIEHCPGLRCGFDTC